MGSFRTDVFVADPRAVFDDVNQRHRVPQTQSEVWFEPVDDEPRPNGWHVEAGFAGEGNKLTGRQGGLFFDRLEVGLKGYGRIPSLLVDRWESQVRVRGATNFSTGSMKSPKGSSAQLSSTPVFSSMATAYARRIRCR